MSTFLVLTSGCNKQKDNVSLNLTKFEMKAHRQPSMELSIPSQQLLKPLNLTELLTLANQPCYDSIVKLYRKFFLKLKTIALPDATSCLCKYTLFFPGICFAGHSRVIVSCNIAADGMQCQTFFVPPSGFFPAPQHWLCDPLECIHECHLFLKQFVKLFA